MKSNALTLTLGITLGVGAVMLAFANSPDPRSPRCAYFNGDKK